MHMGQYQLSIAAKLRIIATIAKDGDRNELVTHFINHFYSTEECYVLRRDLLAPLVPRPQAKIPITVRPLEQSDIPQIAAEGPTGLLLGVIRAGVPQCYVAVNKDNEVCYLQWLIGPEHRERLRRIRFRDMYAFNDDTVMLEFAYTFKRFRGLGIMGAALADIAEQNRQAHWAVTYVDRGNVASLRGCRAAGFAPYMLRVDKWRFFRLIESVHSPQSLESFWNQQAERPMKITPAPQDRFSR
jgi:hypothetical protein